MKLSSKFKAIFFGISGLVAISCAFGADEKGHGAPPANSNAAEALVAPAVGTPERKGYDLFLLNCAHCHGNDARGDEGPDLHGVTKSNTRIASLIKNGAKGEMPKFGSKLSDSDVRALIAFIRSLKD